MSDVKGPDMIGPEEFSSLVETYQTNMLRTCCVLLDDPALAEDAVQETWIKVYRNLTAFRGASSIKTWLMKIAVNTCRDMQRGGWFKHTDRRITPDMLPEASVPFRDDDEELLLQVMKLPRQLREAIILYYYQDMNTEDVGKALGCTKSAVSRRLSKARNILRDVLKEGEKDE